MLQCVFFLKTELLNKDFFDFNAYAIADMAMLMEQVATDQTKSESPADKYAGWKQLHAEDGTAQSISRQPSDSETDLVNVGRFEQRSALDPEGVKKLYLFLGEYGTQSGPKNDVGVIDMKKISLRRFEQALWHGWFKGFDDNGHNVMFRFFIVHFSRSYIKDTKTYRDRAAKSLGLSYEQLCKYTKDKSFAEKLKEVLPLLNYNQT